jgi:ABC-2 type transport system permease protein
MDALTGLGPFLRLVLRRDRVRLTLWFGLAALLIIGIAASIGAVVPTDEARAAYAEETNRSPAEVFMIGRINSATVAGIAVWRVQGLAALLLGLAGAFTVIRHTRTAVEDGYRELLGAAALGRLTPLAASVATALGATLATTAAVTAGYAALGFPATGSVLAGAQFFAAGAFMTGVGAVAAMAAATSRGAVGLAVGVLAVLYAVRGTADAAGLPALHRASPYGWLRSVEPFAADDGRPVLLVLALTAALLGAAALLGTRDVGGGLLPERDGRPGAGRWPRGPVGLAFRLNAGTLAAWVAAMGVFGALVAAVAGSAARQLAGGGALSGLVSGPDPEPAFIAFVAYVFAQVTTVYGIHTVVGLRGDETGGRAENVLAAPVSRLRWAGGALVVALTGTALIQLAFGAGLGVVRAAATGEAGQLAAMAAAALVRLPAVWLLVAVAALLYGAVPRIAGAAAFTVLGFLFLLELLVELGFVGSGVLALSPYARVPQLPVGPADPVPGLVLTGIAAALIAAGALLLRRRDLR